MSAQMRLENYFQNYKTKYLEIYFENLRNPGETLEFCHYWKIGTLTVFPKFWNDARHNASQHFYGPQTKFAKVMFLHVSVCPREGVVVVSQHALQVVSQHALQDSSGGASEHALQVSRPTPRGEVEESGLVGVFRPTPRGSPDPHLGVSIPTPRGVSRPNPWGGVSQHTLRQTRTPQLMAIAAGGTHPTGMHSCCLHLYIFLMVLWKHQRLANLCEQFTVSSSQSGKIGTKFAYQRIGLSWRLIHYLS